MVRVVPSTLCLQRAGHAEHRDRGVGRHLDVAQDQFLARPAGRDGVERVGFLGEERLLDGHVALGLLADLLHQVVLHHELAELLLGPLAFGPLAGAAGIARAVDRLAVDLEPVADLQQPLLHDDGDRAVAVGADVQQQVAAAADQVAQHQDELAGRLVVVDPLGAVVAVGVAHAAALLPGMGGVLQAGGVFGGPVAAVLVPAVLAPAVVDDDLVLAGRLVEQPGQQLLALPVLRGHVPLAVAEDDRRAGSG